MSSSSFDDSDSESESVDFDNYVVTDEQYKEYCKAESESQGFDVPVFDFCMPGMICPLNLNIDINKKEVDRCGELAIKHYNEENGTKFKIIEYEKVNSAVAAGFLYYMTFKATPSGMPAHHPTTTFQALVFDGIKETEVKLCRQKVL